MHQELHDEQLLNFQVQKQDSKKKNPNANTFD